ncbi:MAG: HlyD family type I secretion periplasmic adaptor subunit [Rhodospirillales bacterium]
MSNDLEKSGAGLPEGPSSGETLPVKAVTAQRVIVAPKMPEVTPLKRDLSGTRWLGIGIIAAFFGIGGGWAATAPLSGAAIAHGFVSPEGSRQNVQHLEGGIIREIRVTEGDRVNPGDVLMVLEDVRAQAEVGAFVSRLRSYAAQEARLRAERNGSEIVDFDHPSLADTMDPQVQKVVAQEVSQFEARKAGDLSRKAILGQRVAQLEKQIDGARRQLEANRRQNAYIREEIAAKQTLLGKGFATKPDLLRLQRAEAELMGGEGELLSRIARAEETITETNLQILGIRINRAEEVDQELSQVQARRIEVEERLKDSLDRLTRTMITAPVAGTVLDVRFKTPGGVVRPGEQVLAIVPSEDDLIIDTQVAPGDIDNVHTGLSAYVMFPAFSRRNTPRIDGELIYVSADSFQDDKTGRRFYRAKVKVDRHRLKEIAPHVDLQPGMPAEVFITTAERTVLEYLIEPFTMMLERSFRES